MQYEIVRDYRDRNTGDWLFPTGLYYSLLADPTFGYITLQIRRLGRFGIYWAKGRKGF